jgi:hypothetical protein
MSLKGLLAASVLCSLMSFAPPTAAEQGSATDYIAALYAQPIPGENARYVPAIEKAWKDCLERTEGDADMCPGFNMFVMTKKAKPANLTVEPVSSDGNTAEVRARFNNGERDVEVVFRLVSDPKEGWTIEEMTSECVTLTDALTWQTKC